MRIERIDRIGLELGTQWKTQYHVEENDPLSAVAELSNTQTLSRDEWQIRVETQLRMSSTGNAFLLQGSLRAFEGDERSVPSRLGSLYSPGFLMIDLIKAQSGAGQNYDERHQR